MAPSTRTGRGILIEHFRRRTRMDRRIGAAGISGGFQASGCSLGYFAMIQAVTQQNPVPPLRRVAVPVGPAPARLWDNPHVARLAAGQLG